MRKKNACMLFLTAFIWGTAFVAQSVGMDYLGPFGFNGIRSFIGGIALLPCIYLLGKLNKGEKGNVENSGKRKDLIAGGLSCGVILFAASSMQQLGLQYTTAGKAGFITAFYIVLVPVLGIFLKQKTGWKVWLAVAIALAGLYFLCITESFSIGKGDIYVFIGALLFSLHILVIDHFAPKTDGVKMSCIQFFVAGKKLDPAFVCRSSLQRSRLYTSDHRTEKYESDHCVFDLKSGILYLSTGRMGNPWRTVICQRKYGMRLNVCGNHFGADSRTE